MNRSGRTLLYEDDVKDVVSRFLTGLGYQKRKMARLSEHRPDSILLTPSGHKELWIEAKGETSPSPSTSRYGKPFNPTQKSDHFGKAPAITRNGNLVTSRIGVKSLLTLGEQVLLKRGQTKCTTIHSYGVKDQMSELCRANLEGKELDIREVLQDTFPEDISGLQRVDLPWFPSTLTVGTSLLR